jgi:glycosyltransferase involved in cell wall biosynthesis
MKKSKRSVSAIIPIFNEEETVKLVLSDLISVFKDLKISYEVIAVDDGSTDKSLSILKRFAARNKRIIVISHKKNRGYSAALKTGIKRAKFERILIADGDGTYPLEVVPALLKYADKYDMVVGARKKGAVAVPLMRRPAKKLIDFLVRFLTGNKIPDINSGLRVFRKDLVEKFWHLLPDKFSFTSTLSLASHLRGYGIHYYPINYLKRVGKSSIRPIDFFYFLVLVIRMVIYFEPLRFFFWPGLVFLSSGAAYISYTLIKYHNLTDTGIILTTAGLQFVFFGLIADLIVKTRSGGRGE